MPEKTPGVGRRGLLKGAGASALATSAVMFGTPGRAEADYKHYACCHLYLHPTSWSYCVSGYNYIWGCTWSNGRSYQCCERYHTMGWVERSAYRTIGV
jgi:hypothetical protein